MVKRPLQSMETVSLKWTGTTTVTSGLHAAQLSSEGCWMPTAHVNTRKRSLSLRCLSMELNPTWLAASSTLSPKFPPSFFLSQFLLIFCSPCSYVSCLIPCFVSSRHLFWNNIFQICSLTATFVYSCFPCRSDSVPPCSWHHPCHKPSHLSFTLKRQTCLFAFLRERNSII